MTSVNKCIATSSCSHTPSPEFVMHRCTAGCQWGWGCWPRTGSHKKALQDNQADERGDSGGGSDCRESRCLEQGGHRGDLDEEDGKAEDRHFR